MRKIQRRKFVSLLGTGAIAIGVPSFGGGQADYRRANTDWLAKCRFGIGVHWTAQTVPKHGPARPFEKAVESFDLDGFISAVEHAGANYVLFTATHALQMLPAPNPVTDSILSGRTCERDLIGELADQLAERGKHFLLYYNHSCNSKDDPEWEQAVGYHAEDKSRLAENLMNIVRYMGERYGEKLKAWWFDSSYSLDPSGPHNSVTTDMSGFQFPWEHFTVAAKIGNAERLVTYNAGVAQTYLYTTHQDYWAGELVNLNAPATARFLPNGLQWFGWTCLDDRRWVHRKLDTPISAPLYSDEQVVGFVRKCNRQMAPMTFNVGIYQDGKMAEGSVEQLHRLHGALRP
ncbi:MAG: hypothetical protein GXY83_18335 [Rhodopirellula sp.]|nr:hypothetical protein [Rhodopirellula sp.]